MSASTKRLSMPRSPPSPTDDAAELSTADVQVIEGDTGTTVAHVPVSLTAPADADVVFDVVAVPDTATLADDDYTAPAATGTVPAGTLSGTVELVINGDTGPEEDETVEVHLSNPTVATLGDAVSIVTIRNDDAAVRVADASVVEGDAPERATLAFALELTTRARSTSRWRSPRAPPAAPAAPRPARTTPTSTRPSGSLPGTRPRPWRCP